MSARGIPALEVTDRAQRAPASLRRRAIVLYPITLAMAVLVVVSRALDLAGRWSPPFDVAASLVSFVIFLLVIAYFSLFRTGSGARPPARVLTPVVHGRWLAVATPAHAVPSHGTHNLAQSYAIDMVAEPDDGSRPRFATLAWMRRPQDFPAFGAPLLAGADAVVCHVDDGQRDHLSRSSWITLPYLLAESFVRQYGGYRRTFGNHVILDLGDGTYLAYAHAERGSITVAVGDQVRAGDVIARCGNSGASTEPHLHVQLMDRPRPTRAAGLPFAFAATTLEGQGGMRADSAVVPGRLQTFTTTPLPATGRQASNGPRVASWAR